MSGKINGSCYCKNVKFTFDEKPRRRIQCFCRDCQYFYGGSSQVLFSISDETFECLGETDEYSLSAESGNTVTKYFCKTCHSPVFSKITEIAGQIFIPVGTLDNPSLVPPKATVWPNSAPDWAQINPDLLKFH